MASPPQDAAPRQVAWAGRGLRPAVLALAVLFFIGPGVLSPLILAVVAPGTREAWTAMLAPSLCWGTLAAVALATGVVAPLRRKRLVERGALVLGTVTAVRARGRGRQEVEVAYRPGDGVERRTTAVGSEGASPGDRLQVACWPDRPAVATVVELSGWRVRGPGEPAAPAGSLSVGRLLGLVGLLAVAMGGLMVGLGGPELRGELVLASSAWVVPALLGLGAVAALVTVRRRRLTGPAALWAVLPLLAAPLAVLGAALGLAAVLPERARPLEVTVAASFCLEPVGRSPRCLLELRGPRELSALRLVRRAGPLLAPGEVLAVELVEPALGWPRVRGRGFSARDWHPEPTVGGLFIDKKVTLAELIRAGQVVARGRFAPGSTARAELEALGIPVTAAP